MTDAAAHAHRRRPQPAHDVGEMAFERAVSRLPSRIAGINATTRDGIRAIIVQAIEQGLSPRDAAKLVRDWTGWDRYRAERIARTEMTRAYNAAALDTYGAYDVQYVVADDGDEDEVCAERHGQVYELSEAESVEDHPNGTLDWLPVSPDMTPEQVRGELHQVRPIRGMP